MEDLAIDELAGTVSDASAYILLYRSDAVIADIEGMVLIAHRFAHRCACAHERRNLAIMLQLAKIFKIAPDNGSGDELVVCLNKVIDRLHRIKSNGNQDPDHLFQQLILSAAKVKTFFGCLTATLDIEPEFGKDLIAAGAKEVTFDISNQLFSVATGNLAVFMPNLKKSLCRRFEEDVCEEIITYIRVRQSNGTVIADRMDVILEDY